MGGSRRLAAQNHDALRLSEQDGSPQDPIARFGFSGNNETPKSALILLRVCQCFDSGHCVLRVAGRRRVVGPKLNGPYLMQTGAVQSLSAYLSMEVSVAPLVEAPALSR